MNTDNLPSEISPGDGHLQKELEHNRTSNHEKLWSAHSGDGNCVYLKCQLKIASATYTMPENENEH
jgi:hypothetical protein